MEGLRKRKHLRTPFLKHEAHKQIDTANAGSKHLHSLPFPPWGSGSAGAGSHSPACETLGARNFITQMRPVWPTATEVGIVSDRHILMSHGPQPNGNGLHSSSDGLQPTRNGLQPTSDGLQPNSDGLQPTRNGLQPTSDGLQPNSDGLQPNSHGLQPTTSDGLQPNSDGLKPTSDGLHLNSDGRQPN